MSDKKRKPVFGTREWAELSANCAEGCQHDCRYCYAKAASVKNQKSTIDTWRIMRTNPDLAKHVLDKAGQRVMFPTQHDITPDILPVYEECLDMILKADKEVLIVSKPHLSCIRHIVDRFEWAKEKILFRFTIGSANDSVLAFWEPNAPCYHERVASLMYAFFNGFRTSISSEPMLDVNIHQVIKDCEQFVNDAIWLGLMNFVEQRLRLNGDDEDVVQRGKALSAMFTDKRVHNLYNVYKDNPKIKWKESIKKIVGLDVPDEPGRDE